MIWITPLGCEVGIMDCTRRYDPEVTGSFTGASSLEFEVVSVWDQLTH